MQALPQAATLAVVVLGLVTLAIARLPAFRRNFRRSISITVGAVSLLTILLSLNVMLTGLDLRGSAAADDLAMINGLLLAGFVLMLVSSLAFFFALGVLIWTLVPFERDPRPMLPADPTARPPRPIDPFTP